MIALTATTMNDADILERFVTFHLEEGVDEIVLEDAGSTDDTLELIRALEASYRVKLLGVTEEQNRKKNDRRNRMRQYCEDSYAGGWILSSDVDEFWWAPGAGLKAVLSDYERSDAVALRFMRTNMVAAAASDVLSKSFDLNDFRYSVARP